MGRVERSCKVLGFHFGSLLLLLILLVGCLFIVTYPDFSGQSRI